MRNREYLDASMHLPEAMRAPHYFLDKVEAMRCFQAFDDILGKSRAKSYSLEAISRDRFRHDYILIAESLADETGLGKEIVDLAEIAAFERKPGSGARSCGKKKQEPVRDLCHLRSLLLAMARTCPFEPEWHMRMRGDWRKMPSEYPNGYWRYLVKLYTDPMVSADPVPSWVSDGFGRVKMLEQLIGEARDEAQEALRRELGADWEAKAHSKGEYASILDNSAFLDGSLLDIIRGDA